MARDAIKEFERGFGKDKVVELRDSDTYLAKHGAHFGRARKTKTQRVAWLWPNWIPLGGLTFLCGDSGIGKSVLLSALIAIVTRGRKFPDGAKAPRSHVVYYGIEDSIRAALVPRLKAASATWTACLSWNPTSRAPMRTAHCSRACPKESRTSRNSSATRGRGS